MKRIFTFWLFICLNVMCAGCATLTGNTSNFTAYEKLWTVEIGQEEYERTGALHTFVWSDKNYSILFEICSEGYKNNLPKELFANGKTINQNGREFTIYDSQQSKAHIISWKQDGYSFDLCAFPTASETSSDFICPETALKLEKGDYSPFNEFKLSFENWITVFSSGKKTVAIQINTPDCSDILLTSVSGYGAETEDNGFKYYKYSGDELSGSNMTEIAWNTDIGAIGISALQEDETVSNDTFAFVNADLARRITEQLGAKIMPLSEEAPSGMSSVETVRYYYEQWSNRDIAKMNSIVCPNMRGYDDFAGLISVKLLKCEEFNDKEIVKEGFEPEWYDKTPYDIALVQTTFDVQNEDWANTGLSNGENYCDFYLVKDSADSDWIIVMMGQG